ncbi:MAG: RpiB/LacA/LacB family sugar-phosphate isomerase [Gemmataceae bacterium]|nr:RpiB/LacA/LacB family sugar-phosphate isomerase [Gemmataceae bacterium]
MNGNGQAGNGWGYALQGQAPPMLQAALRSVRRTVSEPTPLPDCHGESCPWVRAVADCVANGQCQGAVLFCDDACVACCVANKVPGVRAVAVSSLAQAYQALAGFGANLLIAEPAGRTFFEFKQLLQLCCEGGTCPPGVACVLEELDGHAHR